MESMLSKAALLALVALCAVNRANAVIVAQSPLDADLTGGKLGTVRDIPPESASWQGGRSRWGTVFSEAQERWVPDPGVPLPEFVELGCAGLGTEEASLMLQNCTELEDHRGSRVRCTAICGEHAVSEGVSSSASAFVRGKACVCCLDDALLEAAEWVDARNCGWGCRDQDSRLYAQQPYKAQRRWSDEWTCGGEEETWTAFRQYDALSPLGRRGAFSPLFKAWYEVVVFPENLVPGSHMQPSLENSRWFAHPGFAYYLHAVHAGLSWPIFWHQARLPFVPECLHVDERGKLMALVRRNSRASGVEVGFDVVVFDVGCAAGYIQDPQVIPAVDSLDAHPSACTFDVERAVLAFVAKPITDVDPMPLLIEVDIVRGAVTSKTAKALENAVALEQCRQTEGGATKASLAALVVASGQFAVLPPQTLAGMGAKPLQDMGSCGREPGETPCVMQGPDRYNVMMQTTSAHATLPFMHVATEFAAYWGGEFEDESSAQLAKLPCEPSGAQAEIWPSSVPGHHRRRGANLEAPHNRFRLMAKGHSARRCARSLACNFTVEGVGVTGDDHLVAVSISEDEAESATCDLRGALIRSISGGGTLHEYFRHDEIRTWWIAAPSFYQISFRRPGLYLLCYYAVPSCTGNISDAAFSGLEGKKVGTLPIQGPYAGEEYFCVAFFDCLLRIHGFYFDEPLFAYLSNDTECLVPTEGDLGLPWPGQPWQFELAERSAEETTLRIPLARPKGNTTICFCVGAQDISQATWMGKCEGPGAAFGTVAAAAPYTDAKWLMQGNFRASEPPISFKLRGTKLVSTNRLIVRRLLDPDEPNQCAGSKLDGHPKLAPVEVTDSGELIFNVQSLTPDAAFKAYGMPTNKLELSKDGQVLRSSFMSGNVNFALCFSDRDIARPYGDAQQVGVLKLMLSICGDGILRSPEACDDGNTVSGDGCSEGCEEVEPGWFMWHNNSEEFQYAHPNGGPLLEEVCGDGLVVGGEICDDNNTISGDGCNRRCFQEVGWECFWSSGLGRSVCSPICGDYVKIDGYEGCDDGNTVGGDGCSPLCKVELGFTCEQGQLIDEENGIYEESVSFCNVDCVGDRDIAEMVLSGIFPCEDGMRPPEDTPPHWCIMFPRDCSNMPPYDGPVDRWLGCTDLAESIKSQCKVIMPPILARAQFLREGGVVVVDLSESAVVKSPENGQDTCEVLFNNSAYIFGQGASCSQHSPTSLWVNIGRKPALRPDMNITVRAGAIYLDPAPILARSGASQWPEGWPNVESLAQGLIVEPPLGGFWPVQAELQSQVKTGLGSDIELDASGSHGGGGHLTFYWGVEDIQLNPVWLQGFFGNSVQKEQQVLGELRAVLVQALNASQGQPVALVPAEAVIFMDEILQRHGDVGEDVNILEPILITFTVRVVSVFDGQSDEDSWMVQAYQYAVPLVKRDVPEAVWVERDKELSLMARVMAPAGLPPSRLPPFRLSWRSEDPNLDISPFKKKNPGILTFPGLTFPRGRWAFALSCFYKAPGGTAEEEVMTLFEVTFTSSVPVAILDGSDNTSAACNTTVSAAWSYDPGLVHEGTRTRLIPLPRDLYQFEWECWYLGTGLRFISMDDRLLAGQRTSARPCHLKARRSFSMNGTEMVIPGGTFWGNSLVIVRMRLKPIAGRLSEWTELIMRFLAVGVPSISFPQVPASPLRATVPHQVWAIGVSSADCPQSGGTRPILWNVGQNVEVMPQGDLPAVELIRTFPDLDSTPPLVKAKVLADSSEAAPFAGQVVSVFWLRVRAGTMQPGLRYRVILRGDTGAWSAQSPIMEANAGPVGGSLSVRPLHGQAVETVFRLAATEWEDPHIPLSFIFWLLPPGGNASSRVVLSDWSVVGTVLIPLPVGNWTVMNRARDHLGMESASTGDLVSDLVRVDEAAINPEENMDRVSLIVERSTDPTQLLSSVASALDVTVGSTARRLLADSGGNRSGQNSSNASGVSSAMAGTMLRAMSSGQELLIGAGSKSGASRQANMLLGISSGIGDPAAEDDENGTDQQAASQMASDAARVLGSTFGLLQGAEDEEDPTGVSEDEARDFVAVASNLAVQEVPDGAGGRRLQSRNLDLSAANTLGNVADGIGRQLAQGLVSKNGSAPAPAPIQTPGLTVAAAAVPMQLGASGGERRLTGEDGGGRVDIEIQGIGTFGIPVEALLMSASSLSDMGYEGPTMSGVSANQWAGNPFGPRQRRTYYRAGCGGANGSFLLGKNLSANFSGHLYDNLSNNFSANDSYGNGSGGCRRLSEETTESALQSQVVSVSLSSALGLGSNISELHNPILITMKLGTNYWKLFEEMSEGLVPQCMWWDAETSSWGGGGCKTLEVKKGGRELLCACTHLTSFGAFAEEGADVLGGSNIDVAFDFSYESLRPDNPTLWFVVSIFMAQCVWICLGIHADSRGLTGGSEEQMQKIYFRRSQSNSNSKKPASKKSDALARLEQPQANNAKETLAPKQASNSKKNVGDRFRDLLPKGHNNPTADLLNFRNMIASTLEHHHISWMDLSSKRVRNHVHGICRDEIKHAMRKSHNDRKQNGQRRNIKAVLLQVFRHELKDRLASQMGRKHLGARANMEKKRRHEPGLPTFPWSFPATLKVSCRGVHPLEEEPQVRRQLRVEEVLNVFVVADEFTVKIFLRDGDFEDAECLTDDPFLEVSWLAIEDHEGIVDDRAVEVDTKEGSAARVAERLEERATSALALPAPRLGRAGDTGAGVGDLCDEWEEEFLSRRERGVLALPPPYPADIGFQPPPPPGEGPYMSETNSDTQPPLPPPEELTEERDAAPEADNYIRWVDGYTPQHSWSINDGGLATRAIAAGAQAGARGGAGGLGADAGARGASRNPDAAAVIHEGDYESSSEGSPLETLSEDGLHVAGTGMARRRRRGERPRSLATQLEDSRRFGFLTPLVDGFWGGRADSAEQVVDRWEDSMMQLQRHATPRLAEQAALLGAGGRGLDFWRCGGTVSEAAGVPSELMKNAMLFLVSASHPKGDDGDMSWVTSGWFFSWSPLQTRELKRLQNQARQAAAAAGRQGPEVPARVEVLLCGLEPNIQKELRIVVPKLCARAQKEEEATRENMLRDKRRREAAGAPPSDSEEDTEDDALGWSSDGEDEDARMRALEARWEAPSRGDLQLARAADLRSDADYELDIDDEDIAGTIFVAIPDTNYLPMQAKSVVEDVCWSPMHLSVEGDAASLDNNEDGRQPAVLRFSDVYEGVPQPFTGWAVPMGRVSDVRVLRHSDYPLPPLDSASVGDVQLAWEEKAVEAGDGFDIDALAHEADPSQASTAANSRTGGLPEEFRELVEIVVAPRDEPLYRILLRPFGGNSAGADRLAYSLRTAAEAWQKEARLRTRPRLAELSRAGQLERQAEDLRQRARDAEDEARKDRERKAKRHAKDMKQINECIDLLFRRYEFILWDPFTLMRRILMRDHPMTGIFVPHLRSFAIERVLIFSCALAGSLMAAGLFYDVGGAAGAAANATGVNGTEDLTTETDTTTTMMDAASGEIVPWRQITRQVWISALSVLIAGIPAGCLFFLFKRKAMPDVVNERQQKRILRWWRIKRRMGYVVAAVFLAWCYFFLWQFAMNRGMDVQKDFTASSAINLIWKIVLKPMIVFLLISMVITAMRVTTAFDSLMIMVPFSLLDFTMFTATDVDDLLRYETLVSEFTDMGEGPEAAGEAGDILF